jgi:L-rhamnose isomerase/sugar isomerase
MNIVDAENCLKEAYATDVRPMLAEWRKRKSIDPDPMKAYRASGYEAKVGKEREARRAASGAKSAGGAYA